MSNFKGFFDLNLSNGAITDGLFSFNVATGGFNQDWLVKFTGMFTTLFGAGESAAEATYITDSTIGFSSITEDGETFGTIDGDIASFLTFGAEGLSFSGGFQLFQFEDEDNYAFGAVVLKFPDSQRKK